MADNKELNEEMLDEELLDEVTGGMKCTKESYWIKASVEEALEEIAKKAKATHAVGAANAKEVATTIR